MSCRLDILTLLRLLVFQTVRVVQAGGERQASHEEGDEEGDCRQYGAKEPDDSQRAGESDSNLVFERFRTASSQVSKRQDRDSEILVTAF